VATISNGLVAGGSNLVLADDVVICHDLYDPVRDYSWEERHRRTFVRPSRNQIAWLMPTRPHRTLARAANFTDACAANYAHWMTEVLPRISLFCENEKFNGIPLLVDAGLHRNLMESLRIVAGEQHEIVTLAPGETVLASELFVVSVTGYVPFERRSNRVKGHSHGTFSPQALLNLRQRIWRNLPPTVRKPGTRIVIRRNSGIRIVTNEHEIEQALVARGFTAVEPERLSFEEQVKLFSNAEIVVGATGAAFANLIFCPPSAKIIIMISNYRHMPYWYWQNMACAVGNHVTYVLGSCTDTFANLHSNFRINPADVLSAIE
jgi:capsular polysaccharide biosynthesis protein